MPRVASAGIAKRNQLFSKTNLRHRGLKLALNSNDKAPCPPSWTSKPVAKMRIINYLEDFNDISYVTLSGDILTYGDPLFVSCLEGGIERTMGERGEVRD